MKKLLSSYPDLVKEWHPTKNGEKKPQDFTYGSSKKAWWICPNGHEYEAKICNRTGRNSGCKRCANEATKPWTKSLYVDGVLYNSIDEASKKLSVARNTLSELLAKSSTQHIKLPDRYKSKSDTRLKSNSDLTPGSIDHLSMVAIENGFDDLESWYSKNREKELPSQFSRFIKKNWQGDWIKFLEDLYPDKEIEFWRLKRIPLETWRASYRANQYLDWLGKKLDFETLNDWYSLTPTDLFKNYGDGLYKYYGNVFNILKIRFPKESIKFWKFKKAPASLWVDKRNHKVFLDYVFTKLQLNNANDWYKVSQSQIQKLGGRSLLKQYASYVECITLNYPELELLPWKFKRVQRDFWSHSENQKQFINYLITKLKIKKNEDYYSISEKHFLDYGGISILSYHDNSPGKAIIDLYPDLDLDLAEFDKASKGQLNLYRFLRDRYPAITIEYNFKHPELKFSDSDRKMEIDIFFPEFDLGIEVQGAQHYRPAWGGEEELQNIISRDEEKRAALTNHGIFLVEINQPLMPMAWGDLENYLKANHEEIFIKLSSTL